VGSECWELQVGFEGDGIRTSLVTSCECGINKASPGYLHVAWAPCAAHAESYGCYLI